MKKKKKIWIYVLIIILVFICGLLLWQKDNLKSLYSSATMDKNEIVQQLDQNQEEQKSLAKKYNISVPTPEAADIQALMDGKMTPEEFREKLGLGYWIEDDQNSDNGQNEDGGTTANNNQNGTAVSKSAADKCVAELYALKSKAMGQINAIWHDTANKLSNAKKNGTSKNEIVSGALSRVSALEKSIDGQFEGIISKYRAQIEAESGDTSLINELRNYYANLKAEEAAYYMNKMMK